MQKFSTLSDLKAALESEDPILAARIQRVEVAGDILWIKRPEVLGWRMYLQKGDGAAAFVREVNAHKRLALAGAAVPEIVLSGPDYIVTKGCGMPLDRLFESKGDYQDALNSAAEALADLHQTGLSHGRPSLKDICWDGAKITFLDFERTSEKRDTLKGHAEDLIIFVFNILALSKAPTQELFDAVQVYLAAAPCGVLAMAKKRLRRFHILSFITWPIRQTKRAWEFKAIPMTLDFFSKL